MNLTATVGFIVATPLQILIALAIIEQICQNSEEIDILVFDYFEHSSMVSRRANVEFRGRFRFLNFVEYFDAIKYAELKKYDHLLLHWDVGFKTNLYIRYLKFFSPTTKISIFEEGIGTYRDDIYNTKKKKIFEILGLPTNVGGHSKIDQIFVYDPKLYISNVSQPSKKIICINNSVSDIINKYKFALIAIFDPNGFIINFAKKIKSKCIIYLTSYEVSHWAIRYIESQESLAMLKPHPHLKDLEMVTSSNVEVCPGGIPVELLIEVIKKDFHQITILHHGSSAQRYIRVDNVQFIHLDDDRQPGFCQDEHH